MTWDEIEGVLRNLSLNKRERTRQLNTVLTDLGACKTGRKEFVALAREHRTVEIIWGSITDPIRLTWWLTRVLSRRQAEGMLNGNSLTALINTMEYFRPRSRQTYCGKPTVPWLQFDRSRCYAIRARFQWTGSVR